MCSQYALSKCSSYFAKAHRFIPFKFRKCFEEPSVPASAGSQTNSTDSCRVMEGVTSCVSFLSPGLFGGQWHHVTSPQGRCWWPLSGLSSQKRSMLCMRPRRKRKLCSSQVCGRLLLALGSRLTGSIPPTNHSSQAPARVPSPLRIHFHIISQSTVSWFYCCDGTPCSKVTWVGRGLSQLTVVV